MSHDLPPTSLPFVIKPERVLDLGPVDVEPFASAVLSLPESFWAAEDDRKENSFEVFHSTQHAVLRFFHAHESPEAWHANPGWQFFGPALLPSMHSIVQSYAMAEPEFPKAMFARLMPGAGITRHTDSAASNLLVHKIHVPVATTPDVQFEVAGEYFHLEVGHAYEVNNVVPHSALNPSNTPRVHFIFEVYDAALVREA
ncbi:MAG: aspartyl beta-hydroxylase [Actinobacteria bacterium]|uniref:Unannotated protein n=1 Tax=freshwater metagenome TaxID=449393 RepID=A0A6J7NQ70_9ZZZZ|nr:aspartyl beta-hydroxylase [Actinomycetota bacterium]